MFNEFLDYFFPLYKLEWKFTTRGISLKGSRIYDSYSAANRTRNNLNSIHGSGTHWIERIKRIDL